MTFSRLNIGNKLAILMALLSFFAMAVIASVFYFQFKAALRERVLLQLSSVRHLKTVEIKNELEHQLQLFKESFNEDAEGYDIYYQGNSIPESVHGFPIKSRLRDPDLKDVQLIDLTLENDDEEIMIGLVGKRENTIKVVIIKIPEIQSILLERIGLGETGESYLVGEDSIMRTMSRFISRKPSQIRVQTVGVVNALAKGQGEGLFPDYRGIEVFSSYELLNFNGLIWVVLSEIDLQEAFFPLKKLRNNFMLTLCIVLMIVLVVAYQLSKVVVKPVLEMEESLIDMSLGVFENTSESKREDEIGRMFRALNKLIHALNRTITFAYRIGDGDFEVSYQPLSERDKLGQALIRMQQKLVEFQERERALVFENQRSMLRGEENERTRLAKEMHDGLGPLLTAVRISLQSIAMNEQDRSGVLSRIDETIREVRRMSNNLMPSVLTDFGAGEAIGNLVAYLREHSQVEILYKNDMEPESAIDAEIQIALYRIAQESITNAMKHAGATEIRISLTVFEDQLAYFIADNGKGFNSNDHYSGNGLSNMKERVKLVGGTFEINSDNHGTTIEVQIPI